LVAGTALAGCGGGGGAAKSSTPSHRTAAPLAVPAHLSIPLTTRVPARVREVCREATGVTDLRVVCPRLVPKVPLVRNHNLSGPAANPTDRSYYLLSFNNGENGRARHWVIGYGAPGPIERNVLSDRYNEVKGNPKVIAHRILDGRRITLYRFPTHPAGGVNGGHVGALVPVGRYLVFASIHGEHGDSSAVLAVAYARQVAATAH